MQQKGKKISGSLVIIAVGTRAEIIKVQPVIADLNSLSIEPALLWMGLHSSESMHDIKPLVRPYKLFEGADRDKKNFSEVAIWFLKTFLKIAKLAAVVRFSKYKPKLVIVHGDTLCTFLGTLFGVWASVPVAHIEACVRSGNLLRPFPEEISRRIISRFASINFTPGQREYNVASRYAGTRINTFHNTSRDALYRKLQKTRYVNEGKILITLHRSELLVRKDILSETVLEIIGLSRIHPVLWFIGEHESFALRKLGLMELLESSSVEVWPRIDHSDFIEKVAVAHCVITDSHGLQYECQDLGVPVAVHRRETEYLDNNATSWLLTHWEKGAIENFVKGLGSAPPRFRGKNFPSLASKIIAQSILDIVEK